MAMSYVEDECDLAERGEFRRPSLTTTARSSTAACSSISFQSVPAEDDIAKATGRCGLARYREWCAEWQFHPACERPFALALDHLANDVQCTYYELEQLEQKNRESGRLDYTQHRSEGDYGLQKEKLICRLIGEVERYLSIFNLANKMMKQPAANAQDFQQYKNWIALGNVQPSLLDHRLRPSEYRMLGHRQSVVDEWIFGLLNIFARCRLLDFFHNIHSGLGFDLLDHHSETLTRVARVVITFVGTSLLLMPLCLLYLLDLSRVASVLVAMCFCLCFCIIIFVFAHVNNDHKFLLVFAYGSILATFLSNLKNDLGPLVPPS